MLDLLYFGSLRDSIGRDGERVDPPSHVLTLADLIAWMALRGGPYAEAFADLERIRGAVEGEAVGRDGSVFGAREVALYPPPGAL